MSNDCLFQLSQLLYARVNVSWSFLNLGSIGNFTQLVMITLSTYEPDKQHTACEPESSEKELYFIKKEKIFLH